MRSEFFGADVVGGVMFSFVSYRESQKVVLILVKPR